MKRIITALMFVTVASFSLAETPVPALANSLETAARTYESGKFDEAHAALDQFEKANSPTAQSLDLRGCVYMEQGKLELAAKSFEAARNAEPSQFAPRLHQGDLLLRQKQYEKARDVYGALLKETNIPLSIERLRFALLMTYLGEQNEERARRVYDRITFPTQSPAYYYAQAAWAFAHGKASEARKWIKTAAKVYEPAVISWFARSLYDFGWTKDKPAPAIYQS